MSATKNEHEGWRFRSSEAHQVSAERIPDAWQAAGILRLFLKNASKASRCRFIINPQLKKVGFQMKVGGGLPVQSKGDRANDIVDIFHNGLRYCTHPLDYAHQKTAALVNRFPGL